MTYKEALNLVETGKAEPAFVRFSMAARQFSIMARTGQLQDPDAHQAADDMLVVMALMHKLLGTPEGKRVLRKNYKGKTYDVLKTFGMPSPEFDIGMRLVKRIINQDTALAQLKDQLDSGRDMRPDRKTLKTILADLEDYCDFMLQEGHSMIIATCIEQIPQQDIVQILDELFQGRSDRDMPTQMGKE